MNPLRVLARGLILLFAALLSSGVTACQAVPSAAVSIAPAATAAPDNPVATPLAGSLLPRQFVLEQIPSIPSLIVELDLDTQGDLRAAHYVNSKNIRIATYQADDRIHNSGVAWRWEHMTPAEKESALRWIFDTKQMSYLNFQGREQWVVNAVSKWVTRVADFTLPAEPEIASLWQSDGPPMSETTL